MQVKMVTRMAGPGGVGEPGQVVEVTAAEALALLEGGFAVAVRDAAVEVAAVAPAETAVVRAPKAPRKKRQDLQACPRAGPGG